MAIKRFDQINAGYIDPIDGQHRYYYERVGELDPGDAIDEQLLYEMYNGEKPGIEHLYVFDTETGKRFEPIAPKENVYFDYALKWCNDHIYFYLADLNDHVIRVYRYLPEKELEVVFEEHITEENLKTEIVPGDGQIYLMIRKYREEEGKDMTADLKFYSPKQFTVTEEDGENLCFIHDDHIYFSNELDDESDEVSDPEYEIVVKDFAGKVVKREPGNLVQLDDGNWWIA